MPSGTIFVGRVPLGADEVSPPTEDLVMSRILCLDGLDEHNANTRDRFIYIHGTRHEDKIGQVVDKFFAVMGEPIENGFQHGNLAPGVTNPGQQWRIE